MHTHIRARSLTAQGNETVNEQSPIKHNKQAKQKGDSSHFLPHGFDFSCSTTIHNYSPLYTHIYFLNYDVGHFYRGYTYAFLKKRSYGHGTRHRQTFGLCMQGIVQTILYNVNHYAEHHN